MVGNKVNDRLEFLAKKFDVFESDKDSVVKKLKELEERGYICQTYTNGDDSINNPLAIVSILKKENGERSTRNISVSLDVFSDIIAADPTPNKSFVQWMLTVFTRYLKSGEHQNIIMAIRFVVEDLPQANVYLELFEGNKRKNRFKELCKGSYVLKNITDPTDINQYKSLSQLFDAVDPFIKKDPTELERLLNRYVSGGQALIPVKDRKFTLFIPKTVDANVVFNNFANWCTAKPGNSMFNNYTSYSRPNAPKSDIYIIINNKFFTGESQEMYQIHFESGQIKDRHNSSNVSIFESVLCESEGISNFFYEELMGMAKASKKPIEANEYIDFLVKFGFCESLFDVMDENTPSIRFLGTREVPRVPDLSRFKLIDQFIITNAKLVELHPSIGNLVNLEMLVLSGNNIKTLPKEIGQLKKLNFINIIGNPVVDIPNELTYLDRSHGGSLLRIAVKESDIGTENYKKLKELLPTTVF